MHSVGGPCGAAPDVPADAAAPAPDILPLLAFWFLEDNPFLLLSVAVLLVLLLPLKLLFPPFLDFFLEELFEDSLVDVADFFFDCERGSGISLNELVIVVTLLETDLLKEDGFEFMVFEVADPLIEIGFGGTV